MKPLPRELASQAGFTLLESIIVLVLSLVIFGTFSLSVSDAVDFSTHNVGAADLQEIGRRTMDIIKRDVAATGWLADAATGIDLPSVGSNGNCDAALQPEFEHDAIALAALAATFPVPAPWPTPANPPAFVAPGNELEPFGIREIVFRLPQDIDGDGRIVDAGTNTIEWSPNLTGFLMIPNAQGTLNLVRRVVDPAGNITDETICRFVEAMTFDTSATKNLLPTDAVEIHLHLLRVNSRGLPQRVHLATTIAMRNSQ
jgi:prepilin-type N-terminal cleavage/methylation domain-containing protein